MVPGLFIQKSSELNDLTTQSTESQDKKDHSW